MVEIENKKRQQNIWIFTMVLAYALCNGGNACINPFFPAAAEEKGVSKSVIGIIMSLVYIPQLILMMVNAKLLIRIGPVPMLKIGLFLTFSSTVAFGFTDFLNSKTAFIISCVCFKIIQGIGYSFTVTVSAFIATEHIPDRMSFVIGLLETGSGVGYTLGPAIGGYIKDQLGFFAPLSVVGGLEFLLFLFSFWSMRGISNDSNSIQSSNKVDLSLLKKAPIIMALLIINSLAFHTLCYNDITLPIYGSDQMGSSSTAIGIYLLIPGLVYGIAGGIAGKFVDKTGHDIFSMEFGLIWVTACEIVIGCLKIYNELSLMVYAAIFTAITFGCAFYYVPILALIKKCISSKGMVIDQEVNAVISSLLMTFVVLGQLSGTALAGLFYNSLGMTNSAILLAAVMLTLALISYVGIKKTYGSYQSEE